jgi:hypothetical protein
MTEGLVVKVPLPLLLALALLALMMPPAAAGPPEGVSGRMVLAPDEVADGLRQYRQAQDQAIRLAWLKKLAPTRDSRVALALWQELPKERRGFTLWECRVVGLLKEHFVRDADGDDKGKSVSDWRKENEADLRRRAKELPR